MQIFLTILILIAAILLILIVIVQNSKGGGLAAGFGESNTQDDGLPREGHMDARRSFGRAQHCQLFLREASCTS